jgi:predicted ATPase
MRPDLPTGTVTFLFTDVEGSTRLLEEIGDEAYEEALSVHRRIVRAACQTHDGVEVDTQGDAFFFAFPEPAGALAAAQQMTEGLVAAGPIQVRVGLHTGAPRLGGEGYVGSDVHFGARVAASAHGGQVVLSQATRDLVHGYVFTDLGEHRLKDIEHAVAIFQLGDKSFPPLKTISNTNLPRPRSSFVGREAELAEVLSEIEQGASLLTLTGPGGSGKTRLALEAAATLVPEYKAGVFWVGLAALRDPALVTEQIGQTLGAKDGLADHIAEREMLLLLDNLEQVVEAAPELSALLQACPNLTLLCTSRELLRVQGEVEYAVPSLASPEAVALFCERSRLEPTQEIAELCASLDNLPLAVELAAARTKALTPAQILERVSSRLDVLKGGRDADPRQQTLRATIEWSYDLLAKEEQRLFRLLSVFRGGCTLEAAEEVAGADLDTLQSLCEKSLLRFSNERYWMLETIREYAAQRLEASGEADAIRRGHAAWYLALAESANLAIERIERGQRYELAIREADNLRSAFVWALAADDPVLAASVAVALEMYWVTCSPHEGARRLTEVLERGDRLPPELRARALRVRGGTTYIMGEFEEGAHWYEMALAAFQELDDDAGVGHMLGRLAIEAIRCGDRARARVLCDQSLRLNPSGSSKALVLSLLGDIAFSDGRGDEALDLLAQSAELAGHVGFRWWRSRALLKMAEYALELGRPEIAASAVRHGIADSRAMGDRQQLIYGLGLAAWVAAMKGQTGPAGRLWGALEAESERAPVGRWELDRDRYATHVMDATPEFDRGRSDGRSLALDDAVEIALSLD